MAIYLNRDYLTQNITDSNRIYIFGYIFAIFLRRVLGYSYVGDTNFFINSTGLSLTTTATTIAAASNNTILSQATTIAAGSNGVSLPTGTINVASTTGFSTSGTIFVVTGAGTQLVAYTGTTGTTFTGCTGGTGAMSTGGAVTAATVIANSTAGFLTSGTIQVVTSAGNQVVNYTGISGASFTGCTGGTGTMSTGGAITKLYTSLIATGDTTPTLAPTFPGGNKAGINFGVGTEFQVSIPVGIRTVVAADVGRILVLKSTNHPRHNSGAFLITSINVGTNRYTIDYRSTENPPAEPADSIMWWLYDKDINCPVRGANNTKAAGEYRGDGNSTTPRIILQSPHALGWQVRICLETATDVSNQAAPSISTVPGFGGNAAGDFLIAGSSAGDGYDHLHAAIYYNASSVNYYGGTLGGGDNSGTIGLQYRITLIGDDTTGQTVTAFSRRTGDATGPNSFSIHFGLPDNEPVPLPIHNISRFFIIGSQDSFGSSGNAINDISLSTGYNNPYCQGTSATSPLKIPTSCSPSLWAYVTGNSQTNSPIFDASAGDCPFISATELLPVDLIAGTIPNWTSSGIAIFFPYEPRFIGTIPLIRSGRANFGNFVLTSDNATWSVSAATNASPIQITTSTTNTLVTGQMVTISGVGGNLAANKTYTVTVLNNTQFTLDGSTGNGAYTSGGTVARGSAYQHTRRGIFMPWSGPSVV
jgi:hypothetical protein